jgi:hypothetical protein
MAVAKNTVWYCNFGNGTSTGYYAITTWAASTAYTVGLLRRQLTAPSVANERVFVCISASTSLASEPTWVLTKGAKTTETAGPVWMECTGQPGVNGDAVNTPLSSANRSGAQVLGSIIQNNAGTFYFICTTAGTSGATEPTYVTTAGSTTVDSGCTWTCIAAVGGYGAWGAPNARLQSALATNWAAQSDTIYISNVHTETQPSGMTLNTITSAGVPTSVICVNSSSGNTPPLSTDVTTGGSLSTTGVFAITIGSANIDVNGLTFNSATSGTSGMILGGATQAYVRLNNCQIVTGNTSSAPVTIGSTAGVGFNARVELVNTTIKVASNSGVFTVGGFFRWRDTASAFTFTGTAPQSLVLGSGSQPSTLFFEGVDLSGFNGSTSFLMVPSGSFLDTLVFSGCKLAPTAVTPAYSPASSVVSQGRVEIANCDSGGATYRHERWWGEGNQVVDTTVVRTSGASDGTTALAWKINTTAVASWPTAFETLPILIWNPATGSNVNVTLQGLYNGAALPFNDGVWMDCRYYGTSGSTLLSTTTGTKANVLTTHTAQTASTVAWDSIATTRLNSTVYAVGGLFRLSSNAGQLFICITAGTSLSSQPVAYTSVADGVSVTDGTAVFRALVRFSMTVTLSSPQPQIAGYIRCYVKAALASSTFWVDPLITLS